MKDHHQFDHEDHGKEVEQPLISTRDNIVHQELDHEEIVNNEVLKTPQKNKSNFKIMRINIVQLLILYFLLLCHSIPVRNKIEKLRFSIDTCIPNNLHLIQIYNINFVKLKQK